MPANGLVIPVSATALTALAVLSAAHATLVKADDQSPHTEWVEFSYEPYPLSRISEAVGRYPEAAPQTVRVSQHGEIEHLGGGVFGTHWFVEADGPVWHFVTAGDPSDDVVLMVHGYPDTWWANADVMSLLADDYYVIAVDVLGYGQSDKGPETDVSYAAAADSLVTLLDKIGVTEFNLISHDRGTIISENLLAIEGASDRVLAFVRMQQSFDQPHGLPRPPHEAMATVEFQNQPSLARSAYSGAYGSVQFPERFLQRLDWEFGFPGTAEAAARTFQGTSFDIELAFRMEKVVPKMTMPVLLVQGDQDPGQKAEEYMTSADLLPDARVAIVGANHFLHAEDPHMVADLARELFENGNQNRSEMVFSHPVNFQFPAKN
ncbi:MAG: alpha/beta hydrolase [Pseudomonadota bacterium]